MKLSSVLLATATLFGSYGSPVLAINEDGSTVTGPVANNDGGDLPISDGEVTVVLLNPSDYDADFTKEEQEFISTSLVKAFHKTHGNSDVLDLAGVVFEGQTHEPATAETLDDFGETMLGKRDIARYRYDYSQFFPMWHCRRGWCPSSTESFILEAQLDGELDATKSKKTRHAAWESKLAKFLKNSNYPVFEHIEGVKITFDNKKAVNGLKQALATQDDGDLPISDGEVSIVLLNPTEYDADFTKEEQEFISTSLVKAFHKTHGNSDVLDLAGVVFEGQTHEPATAETLDDFGETMLGKRDIARYRYDYSQFFPMWHCRRGWCPSSTESFILGAQVDGDLDATKTKKTSHAAWESQLSKYLKNSNFPVFEHIEGVKITFENKNAINGAVN